MTHTSGLGYWFWNADLARYEQVTGTPNVLRAAMGAFKAPMIADPGTRFVYGINTDWLGRVVEAVAGQGLDVVVKEGITGPLGMGDTMFLLDEARTPTPSPSTSRVRTAPGSRPASCSPQQPEWWAGGHGLYSTPRDYVRFQRALLRGGELDGERILQQDTVDAAFTNQIGDLDFPAEIATADPAMTDEFHARPGLEVGLRPAAQHGRRPGPAAGRVGRLGRSVQHPLLGRPDDRDLRVHLHELPAVHP